MSLSRTSTRRPFLIRMSITGPYYLVCLVLFATLFLPPDSYPRWITGLERWSTWVFAGLLLVLLLRAKDRPRLQQAISCAAHFMISLWGGLLALRLVARFVPASSMRMFTLVAMAWIPLSIMPVFFWPAEATRRRVGTECVAGIAIFIAYFALNNF